MSRFTRRLARSRLAPVAAFPVRAALVARHDIRVLRRSSRWLLRSREHTNFTYGLEPLNVEHLVWWVANVTGVEVGESRGYIQEAEGDTRLVQHVLDATAASPRRGLADKQVRLGRRLGWYALVRALKPTHVVETGTDKGLGSVVLAAALLANGTGRLTTIDINPDAGYLIGAPYDQVTELILGDSVKEIAELMSPVDFFLHDSWHTFEHETAEYEAVAPFLMDDAVVLSDNADVTNALPRWAEQTGRQFHFFAESPADHWCPGGGIGIAVTR